MIYSEKYEVSFEDCKKSSHMALESILRVAENLASHHSDNANNNVFRLSLDDGIVWVLVEWNVNIIRTPKYREKLLLSTWSHCSDNTRSVKREFLFTGEDGKHCVEILTKFMLIDRDTGLPVRITEERVAMYDPENKLVFDDSGLGIVKEPKEWNNEIVIPLRRSDIDFNDHVHNLNYLEFALEAIPETIYKNDEYSSLRVIYRKAMKAKDEEAFVKCKSDGKTHTVCIYSKDSKSANCIIVLTEK